MEQKLFAAMTAAERQSWLTYFQSWVSETLPSVEKATTITSSLRTAIELGLSLLAAFPFCRSFVNESLRFKDYLYRLRLLRKYTDKVTEEVQKVMQTKVDLTDPALLVPHVGRPTKEEAAARALKAEQERLAAEAAEQTLFGTRADIPTVTPAAPNTVSGSVMGGALLHLDQLKLLLSPALQEAVETIRDLRNSAAENATRAKQMALDGKVPEKIEPYAQAAARDTEAYEHIYERVDDELAMVYVRLKEDTAYIEAMKAKKIDPTELRTTLRPYWDKIEDKDAYKAKVIEDIKANDPEQAAIREAEEKKRKQIADIIKYLSRKDKPNTPKRIETMKARFAELKTLVTPEEAAPYQLILDAAIQDCQNNVLPAKEVAKEQKKEKK